jgi:hypothetical protein
MVSANSAANNFFMVLSFLPIKGDLSISRLHFCVLPKSAELVLALKQHLTRLGRQNSA